MFPISLTQCASCNADLLSLLLQTDLTTHVSTQDVAKYSPSALVSADPSPNTKPHPSHTSTANASTRRGDENAGKGSEILAKPKDSDTGQVGRYTHCYTVHSLSSYLLTHCYMYK